MANQYPGTLNTFSNPAGTNTLPGTEASGLPHATQHSDLNDAVESHEAVLGTNSGTSVLKHFTAGQFPIRATGVAAIGTLQQTLIGGSVNNTAIGTSNLIGGTLGSAFIGTPTFQASGINTADAVTLLSFLGTSGIRYVENNTLGSFTNTAYGNGTNIGSITFTPQVASRVLVFGQVTWDNVGNFNNLVELTIDGGTEAMGANTLDWIANEQPGTFTGEFTTNSGFHFGTGTLAAGTSHTVIGRMRSSGGTLRPYRRALLVIPFPAT